MRVLWLAGLGDERRRFWRDGSLGTQDLALQRTSRTVFFKVGYAWVR